MIASIGDPRARIPSGRYAARRRVGTAANPVRPESARGVARECTREIGAATKRGLWAMHAEAREFMGQASGKAPIVTGNAPISPSAALISTDTKESGLWLWQGEVPPSPSLPGPKSRDQRLLRRIMIAARWAGWIVLPGGLVLILIAMSMMPHPDRPVSADAPAVALSSTPPHTATGPIPSVLPAEVTEAKLDRVQAPPTAKITAPGPEPRMANGRAQRKSSRTARRTYTSHVRRGPPVPIVGVLTPPVMAWHGGGY
jgi:hypothetical protein